MIQHLLSIRSFVLYGVASCLIIGADSTRAQFDPPAEKTTNVVIPPESNELPPDDPSSVAKLSPQQRIDVEKLRKSAASSQTVEELEKALAGLSDLGDSGKPALLGTVRQLLNKDRATIESRISAIGSPDKAKAWEEQLASTRKLALDNIPNLSKTDNSVPKAEEYHRTLMGLEKSLSPVFAARESLASLLARRAKLVEIYRSIETAPDRLLSEDEEKKLATKAERALGTTSEVAASVPQFGAGSEPIEAAARAIWHYRACRKIEKYNESQKSLANREEYINLQRVNAYREGLGILPYELDARLTQSARQHSKEMNDLGYFAHESPTPSNASPFQRMANAGYSNGYGENIAKGYGGGDATFWGWFHSPGHHKNMANPSATTIGIGQWGDLFTQNFGTGERLMLASEVERKKVEVKGKTIRPQ